MQETILISLPLSELQTLIIDSVNACLDVRISKDLPQDKDQIFNIQEAADYLKLSVQSLYRLCGDNKLPHFKKGKKIRFSREELTCWVKSERKEIDSEKLLSPTKIKKSHYSHKTQYQL